MAEEGLAGAPSELNFALSLCEKADAISLELFRAGAVARRKQDRSFVTDADLRIETVARQRIGTTYPGHDIVGEEFGGAADDVTDGTRPSRPRWYIDPIDATHNFMRGIPVFATLLALEDELGMRIAAVSAPALGARWYAWRDGGAWCQPTFRGHPTDDPARRLAVSSIDRLEDAQILSSSGVELALQGPLPGFGSTVLGAWRERGFGDFWGYALVAEGGAEAMVEVGMHSWDLAPMQLLVEEAGGRLTDLDGTHTIHGAGAIATNGRLHDEIMRALTAGPDVARGTV